MIFWLLFAFMGSSGIQATFVLQESEQRPLLTVYYEAFCPGCNGFMINSLYPTYTDLGPYIDVDLVPYGNVDRALKNGTWTFRCQHQDLECDADKLQACGLERSPNTTQSVEFVYCIEKQVSSSHYRPDIESLAKMCASKVNMSEDDILECAKGDEGNRIFASLADKQMLLAQSLPYVPGIFVDYLSDRKYYHPTELREILCELLDNKPAPCSKN